MRIPALTLAAFLLAALQISSVHGQTEPASYGSVLSGTIQSPICSSGNFVSGDAAGDLEGSFFLAFDCREGSISGGTWLILLSSEGPGGTTDVRGTIRGQVLDGWFEVDANSERMVVRSVSLAVTEGSGEYAAITGGTGSLDGTSDPDGAPQFVGTIGLTF